MLQLVFIILTSSLLVAMLLLFARKAGLQLQYLRLQRGESPGKIGDFLSYNWSDAEERALRWQAFLMFPMLYAVVLEDGEDEALRKIKREVKRTHILIYLAVVALLVLGIYSEKVFPQG